MIERSAHSQPVMDIHQNHIPQSYQRRNVSLDRLADSSVESQQPIDAEENTAERLKYQQWRYYNAYYPVQLSEIRFFHLSLKKLYALIYPRLLAQKQWPLSISDDMQSSFPEDPFQQQTAGTVAEHDHIRLPQSRHRQKELFG